MAVTWISTKFSGVRYYEHPSRKHGIMLDRYYAVRYQQKGKRVEEGLGWASDPQERWTAQKAALVLAELKNAAKMGRQEAARLSERRKAEEKRRLREEKQRLDEVKAARTFADYAEKVYFPWAEQNKRPNTLRSEKMLCRIWVNPLIGNIPMPKIAQTDLERMKKRMADEGKSAKTVNLAIALIRQIYNHAKHGGDYTGDNPTSLVKKPKVDNAKLRYLSPTEIDMLLKELAKISQAVHDQALLAVNAGLRFSEIAGLTWQDVNFETRTLSIRDAKTGSRTAFMNAPVTEMLERRKKETTGEIVFPAEKSEGEDEPDTEKEFRQTAISKTFQRVADLLFNKGVDDRRLRVSFHTLRHTFGSLIYQQTGDVYLAGKALGHKTLVMAMRYAKQSEVKLRQAFESMVSIVESGKVKTDNGQVVNFTK